ncbi:sugar ABC transporter substrate-binding protein [Amycolatopsis panacis]|uniref:sugar ABC transporter substrate-binding protein n=1 Tax=Amycolatopsis panacis TaxID=2340917 RepID=UPI001313E2B2|nr:sugar ABC transporter substrate-binding protein [Amycolatopsis panacis]
MARKVLIAWGVAAALLLAGCGGQGAASGQKIKVGLVTQAWDNPAIKDMSNAAEAAATAKGNIELLSQDSRDMQDMVTKLQAMIGRGVKALGIEPWDKQQIMPILNQAKAANIPVFILQSEIDGAHGKGLVVTSIIGDETAGGTVAGTWLGQQLKGPAKVAVLEGAPADTPGIERANGFVQGLSAANPSAAVVARQPADWARDKALRVTTDILTAHPDVHAVFADNDEMAFGAISALEARNLKGKVPVVGYNGTCIGLRATYQGTFAADGILFLDHVGAEFVNSVVARLDGKNVPEKVEPPITLLTTAGLKQIADGAKSVDVNGKPFAVDAALAKRVNDAVAGRC